MNYHMRVLVGVAAVLLMAVVFAQPGLAQTETYSSIAGLGDMTIVNPSFEADKANPGQLLSGKYTGWTKISGDPAGISGTYGLGFSPIPQLPPGLASPSVIPPVGYTMASGGSQVLATWQDAVIGQTLQKSGGGNYSTAAHQTYVMTWEYGAPATLGNAWGWTVGIFYSNSSSFMQVNNDTNFGNPGHYNYQNGYMYQFAWSFTTDTSSAFVGKSMTVRLGGGTTAGTGYDYFDNIHVYGPVVPEPSTVALLVTGGLALLAYAWRKKRRK